VYDSVGETTFTKSINCLAPRGMLVLFGQSSGPVAPFDPLLLSRKGSLFLTRPSLTHYMASVDELRSRARDLFAWVGAGTLRLRMEFDFPLREAAKAHAALEGRQTTGKVLLIP
jgi:NADPH2:quinone reductase